MNKGLGSKILELYSKGYTRKQIVEELNCCKSVVSYHLSNKHKSIKKKDICECGRPKSIIAERCSACENKLRRERLFNRTLQDIEDCGSLWHGFKSHLTPQYTGISPLSYTQ